MATIKSFSDLQQSKKLAKILPIESADMHYGEYCVSGENYPIPNCDDDYNGHCCWSLAALLGVLPTLDDRNAILCKDIRYDKWHVNYHSTATLFIIDTERYDNPVDACVDMITKLHELNLL